MNREQLEAMEHCPVLDSETWVPKHGCSGVELPGWVLLDWGVPFRSVLSGHLDQPETLGLHDPATARAYAGIAGQQWALTESFQSLCHAPVRVPSWQIRCDATNALPSTQGRLVLRGPHSLVHVL